MVHTIFFLHTSVWAYKIHQSMMSIVINYVQTAGGRVARWFNYWRFSNTEASFIIRVYFVWPNSFEFEEWKPIRLFFYCNALLFIISLYNSTAGHSLSLRILWMNVIVIVMIVKTKQFILFWHSWIWTSEFNKKFNKKNWVLKTKGLPKSGALVSRFSRVFSASRGAGKQLNPSLAL